MRIREQRPHRTDEIHRRIQPDCVTKERKIWPWTWTLWLAHQEVSSIYRVYCELELHQNQFCLCLRRNNAEVLALVVGKLYPRNALDHRFAREGPYLSVNLSRK